MIKIIFTAQKHASEGNKEQHNDLHLPKRTIEVFTFCTGRISKATPCPFLLLCCEWKGVHEEEDRGGVRESTQESGHVEA